MTHRVPHSGLPRTAGLPQFILCAGALATAVSLAGCRGPSPFDDPELDRLVSASNAMPWEGDGAVVPHAAPVRVPDRAMAAAPTALPGFEDLGPLPPPQHSLADLATRALEMNPATRMSWQQARMAAAQQGIAESMYLPRASLVGEVSYTREVYPAVPGALIYEGGDADAGVSLSWLLLDFGRRDAALEAARKGVEAANLSHNRELQRVIFEVQRAYFDLDARLSMVQAAEEDLANARMQLEAVEDRMTVGLATRPELLEVRQQFARAQYRLESARSKVYDARAALAIAVGVPAGTRIEIVPLQRMELPTELLATVESVVEQTLRQRPDLLSAMARVRETREAVKLAEADFMPTVSLFGSIGAGWLDGQAEDGTVRRNIGGVEPVGQVGLAASWLFFDGSERASRLHGARAAHSRADAEVDALRLAISNEVWMAYFDVRTARTQLDAGEALLASSKDSYDATFEAYVNGLATITQLIESEAGLFEARYILIDARASLLRSTARLAYASGSSNDPAGARQ